MSSNATVDTNLNEIVESKRIEVIDIVDKSMNDSVIFVSEGTNQKVDDEIIVVSDTEGDIRQAKSQLSFVLKQENLKCSPRISKAALNRRAKAKARQKRLKHKKKKKAEKTLNNPISKNNNNDVTNAMVNEIAKKFQDQLQTGLAELKELFTVHNSLESIEKQKNEKQAAAGAKEESKPDVTKTDVTKPDALKAPETITSKDAGSSKSNNTRRRRSSLYKSADQFISENIYLEGRFANEGLKPVVIDGSNIAYAHGKTFFSVKGLKICIDFFLSRRHKVYAFVPHYRLQRNQTSDYRLLNKLVEQRLVFCTASRSIFGRQICSYDDRILVQAACAMRAVIVSNDHYRDLLCEDPRFAPIISRELLMPTFIEDMIIFPTDPLGKGGPSLERFLRFP